MASGVIGMSFAAESDVAFAQAASATVCLAGKQQVGKEKGQPFVIAMPAAKSDKFMGRGFVQVGCAGARIQSEAERRQMCALSSSGIRALRLAFWQRFLVTPAEFCRDLAASPAN
jgi:hypothetical protein